MTLAWNNQLGQAGGLPKFVQGHLYRARWVAQVPCALVAGAPVEAALAALGFYNTFVTTDSAALYGRTPLWPDSRKGIPDDAGPSNCAVFTEHPWGGADLFFIPEVLTSVPGLRIWDLWDEDAPPGEQDFVRRGVAVTPTPLPPVPPITPPVVAPPPVTPSPAPPPAPTAAKKSRVAWLWVPVVGLVGAIFVGTLRKPR